MQRKLALFLATCAMAFASTANADVLILVDLSVTDQVTFTATDGLSAITTSGSSGTGIYLEDFYNNDLNSVVSDTLITGDLTNAENPSDGSPAIWTSGTLTDRGLNMFSWSTDGTVSFTAGSLAFTGSATWTVDSADYADMLAGNTFGDLWFPADTVDDLTGAGILGQWQVVSVPEPASALALLGLGGLVIARRRK